jgi:TonB family protein
MKPVILIAMLFGSFTLYAQADSTMYGYVDSATFRPAEIKPFYPGGDAGWKRFLAKNLQYPKKARWANVTGTVTVEFTVDKTGHTSNYAIFHSVDPNLDKEALRLLIKSNLWFPAIAKGTQVVYRTREHVEFKLDDNN